MKRLYAWLAGLAGGAAAYRAFRRRSPEPAAPEPDPADALKAKLAQSKQTESKQTDTGAAEPVPAGEPADVEGRRSSVHEQARAAIDEMNAGS